MSTSRRWTSGAGLRPGGVAIVGVTHKWTLYLRPLLVLALDALGCYAYSPERSFSARGLRVVLEKSGLRWCAAQAS